MLPPRANGASGLLSNRISCFRLSGPWPASRVAPGLGPDRAFGRGTGRDNRREPRLYPAAAESSHRWRTGTGEWTMAVPRGARRAAERAARERLAGPLINAAGQLGVAVAQQQAATAGVVDAKHKAQAHLRKAQLEADSMLTDARDHVTAAAAADDDADYRQAHGDALTAGWSPARADMGYSPPAPPSATGTSRPHPTRHLRRASWHGPRTARRASRRQFLKQLPASSRRQLLHPVHSVRPILQGPSHGRHSLARTTTVQLIDDLDGSMAAETVRFAVDGRCYEIDLSAEMRNTYGAAWRASSPRRRTPDRA